VASAFPFSIKIGFAFDGFFSFIFFVSFFSSLLSVLFFSLA
jgi:hypothetical protein